MAWLAKLSQGSEKNVEGVYKTGLEGKSILQLIEQRAPCERRVIFSFLAFIRAKRIGYGVGRWSGPRVVRARKGAEPPS